MARTSLLRLFLGRELREVLCPPCLLLGPSLVLMVKTQEESLRLGIIGSSVAKALAGSMLPTPSNHPGALFLQWLCLLLHHPEGACISIYVSGFDLSKPLSFSETISSSEKECMCVWWGVGGGT